MKTNKFFKRLTLSKQTIADLNTREMRRLAGGFQEDEDEFDLITDSCEGHCELGPIHPVTYPYHSCVEYC